MLLLRLPVGYRQEDNHAESDQWAGLLLILTPWPIQKTTTLFSKDS